ncbi:UNVERIFIED_CONTAM: DDE-type integrase/transposase/recombinase, partial [Limosilactobacillus fermentum]
MMHRSNNAGPLYPVGQPAPAHAYVTGVDSQTWHRRLGHPSPVVLRGVSHLLPYFSNYLHTLCHACQLGKHVRLPFYNSSRFSHFPFQLLHTDLWQSPFPSVTGFKFYMILLDDFSHYLWVFPLRHKSDATSHLNSFVAYMKNHFNTTIKTVQCDNGTEYRNSPLKNIFDSLGILFRYSCPHTSQQNGRAERTLRTLNNTVRTLLFQAQLSPEFWVEALHMAAHLFNIIPTTTLNTAIPHTILYRTPPDYSHLRVFGCLCYPNLAATTPHKLAPRSARCVFLGYPINQRGFRCLNLDTNKIIISRHVVFDESSFPFAHSTNNHDLRFLDDTENDTPLPSLHLPAEHPKQPSNPI